MSPDHSSRAGTGEAGATAVEYALLVALIAVVIIGTVGLFGQSVADLFPPTIINALGG